MELRKSLYKYIFLCAMVVIIRFVRFTDTQLTIPVLGTASSKNVRLSARGRIETTGGVGDTCVKTKLSHK